MTTITTSSFNILLWNHIFVPVCTKVYENGNDYVIIGTPVLLYVIDESWWGYNCYSIVNTII